MLDARILYSLTNVRTIEIGDQEDENHHGREHKIEFPDELLLGYRIDVCLAAGHLGLLLVDRAINGLLVKDFCRHGAARTRERLESDTTKREGARLLMTATSGTSEVLLRSMSKASRDNTPISND